MLRITVIEKSDHAVAFRVEGEVSGRWVAGLRRWTLDMIFSKDFAQYLEFAPPMVSRPEEAEPSPTI